MHYVDSVSVIHLYQDVATCHTSDMPGRGEAVGYVHFPVTPAELMWPGIGRNMSHAVDDFV